jgi:hypothetical protein
MYTQFLYFSVIINQNNDHFAVVLKEPKHQNFNSEGMLTRWRVGCMFPGDIGGVVPTLHTLRKIIAIRVIPPLSHILHAIGQRILYICTVMYNSLEQRTSKKFVYLLSLYFYIFMEKKIFTA